MPDMRDELMLLPARGTTRVLLSDGGVDIEQYCESEVEPDSVFIPVNDLAAVVAALEDARKRLEGG